MSLFGALIALAFQNGFGSGDTVAFLYWTLPLATGLAVSGPTILALFRTENRFFRLILAIFAAALIVLGFVCVPYLFLGGWTNAFSIPVFYLWIAGTFGKLIFLDLLLPRRPHGLYPSKRSLR